MDNHALLPPLADWERAHSRWSDPAYADARRAVEDRARAALGPDLRPVTEPGGWGHAFYCPDHVEPLEFEPVRPAAHRCPVDGKLFQGEDFDGGWVCALNARIMGGMQSAAVVWRLDGDTAHRDYVLEVVMRYAEIYPDLPPYGRWAGKGRITGQSLEEAVWALGVVDVVDRMGDALDTGQRATIDTGLLRPLADHLLEQRLLRIHNIECWHLASLATLGVALDDEALIAAAVDGPTGLHAQFDNGILDDGWWVEGSPHYHFYMATAMLHAVRALRERRPDLADRPDLREMLITPLAMVRDDLSLPAFNDGWHSISLPNALGIYAGHYEIGHALWADPRFGQVLAAVRDRGQVRASEAALLYGPDLAAPAAPTPVAWPRKDLHPSSGYAILRDDDRSLFLKYGPHGGGHGHPDKLQVDWFAHGVRLAPDAGSPAYTSPLQGPWFRQTLAHSTVVVDGESQPPGTGELLAHTTTSAASPIGLADATVAWIPGATPEWGGSWLAEPKSPTVGRYGGVRLRRTVLWHPRYWIDLVTARTPADGREVELLFHHRGVRSSAPDLVAVTERGDGPYAHLATTQGMSAPARCWDASWQVEGVTTRLWAYDPVGGRVVMATSPTSPPAEHRQTTLRRAHGQDLAFISVVEAWRDRGTIAEVGFSGELADGTLAVTVRHEAGTDRWLIGHGADTGVTAVDGVHRVVLAPAPD